MGKKKVTFIAVPAALAGNIIQMPVISEDVQLLFVDWVLDQYTQWCTKNRKKSAITRAEVAFPGPFMRLTANRRSFYYAWDRDHGRGIEITRKDYPRVAAQSHSVGFVPAGDSGGTIAGVRRGLSMRLAPLQRELSQSALALRGRSWAVRIVERNPFLRSSRQLPCGSAPVVASGSNPGSGGD